jgi:thiol-disulfide isomerase/thioredoxin
MNTHKIDWKKYIIAFLITAFIFSTAIYISNYLNQKKIDEIKNVGDKISIDIMSSETQFDLLAQSSCKSVENSSLIQEINSLGEKLSYIQDQRGTTDPEVISLKKYYSLLEIKDYLLQEKISEKCHTDPLFIIYLYSTKSDCPDCDKESYVLTSLHEKYPGLKVYSFDYNLDLSAIHTMISIYKIENKFPVLIMNDSVYNGFQSMEDIEKASPELQKLAKEMASSRATSTKVK